MAEPTKKEFLKTIFGMMLQKNSMEEQVLLIDDLIYATDFCLDKKQDILDKIHDMIPNPELREAFEAELKPKIPEPAPEKVFIDFNLKAFIYKFIGTDKKNIWVLETVQTMSPVAIEQFISSILGHLRISVQLQTFHLEAFKGLIADLLDSPRGADILFSLENTYQISFPADNKNHLIALLLDNTDFRKEVLTDWALNMREYDILTEQNIINSVNALMA